MKKQFLERIAASRAPIPMCILNKDGKVIIANKFITRVFPYDDLEGADFFTLTGVRMSALETDDPEKLIIERNGRRFQILSDREPDGENRDILVFFKDITDYEELKSRLEEERICICRINVDNYDQFSDEVEPDTGMHIGARVERTVRDWGASIRATVDKIKDTLYIVYFHSRYLDGLIRDKFPLLDDVRRIHTGTEFPLTLSLGIGAGGKDITETRGYAVAALELALGRGGDQVVIKDGQEIRYFGGKTQSIDIGSKGKSRMIAHALAKLIEEANRVLIMGHRHADMDSFGSALGIYRICAACGTEASIVIDEVGESLEYIYNQARAMEFYNLISTEKARQLADKETLLVVVDTQRLSYLEAPDLLEKAGSRAVIDHHRRAEDYIESPTLSYIATYASSAAELVTEMLPYVINKKSMVKLEAEALLAGIMVDTNGFAMKTGVRTFEAAAWLRRAGADTTEVKRFFQVEKENLLVQAQALAGAVFHEDGIAMAVLPGRHRDAQVIGATVADALLNVRGVRASFVAGNNEDGITCLNARSMGESNVQLIAEKLGGGGHLNTAGAQLKESPHRVLERVQEILEKEKNSAGNSENGR